MASIDRESADSASRRQKEGKPSLGENIWLRTRSSLSLSLQVPQQCQVDREDHCWRFEVLVPVCAGELNPLHAPAR